MTLNSADDVSMDRYAVLDFIVDLNTFGLWFEQEMPEDCRCVATGCRQPLPEAAHTLAKSYFGGNNMSSPFMDGADGFAKIAVGHSIG